MKQTVLVTAIGTAASTTIVLPLRAAGEYYIIGGDIYKKNQVVTAKDVDEFYTFPSAIKELDAYIDFVVRFCKEHHVNFYFATIDEEIANLSKSRKKFESIGVSLCIPNHNLVMTCHYKDTFSDWVRDNIPEIFIKRYGSCSEVTDTDFPIFMKPIDGRASLGCRKIENKEALESMKREGVDESNFVIQQYTEGEDDGKTQAREAGSSANTAPESLEVVFARMLERQAQEAEQAEKEQDSEEEKQKEPLHVRIRGYNDHERKAVYMEGFITPEEKHTWKVEELTVTRIGNDRAFFRLETNLDAVVTTFGGFSAREQDCKMLNISVGGARILSEQLYHEGDKFLLKVQLLEDRPMSVMFCEVLRVFEREGSKYEYGCRFLELNEEDQDKITQNIFAAQLAERRKKRGQ